ncbi:hypothetical protein Tco_1329912 [Tanacetum coccineum]
MRILKHSEKESGKDNESSAENLVQNPSESEATSDNESQCDLKFFDDSSLDVFEDNYVISLDLFFILMVILPLVNILVITSHFLRRTFSPKIDPLLEEFAGELALINPIPPGIARAEFDPEGDISLVEKLLYDNSSPRPPEELNSKISDTMIESFSSSPIPVKDSDALMEIDISFWPRDVRLPPGNRYSQKDKNKAKTGQNQARDWKEHGKPKPKAYAS